MSPGDDPRLVTARGIVKTFRSGDEETEVLKALDLEIPRGRMIALLGPSGSGKSTLLNILGLLMRPTAGDLVFLGERMGELSDDRLAQFRNRHLGFVFQYHHLLPDFTATENVAFPAAAPAGRLTADIRARAHLLLDRVGLTPRRDFRATQLSGGQKQRVAIARALINLPDLVLADEPTGNLDRESSRQVMALLRDINRRDGATFLISTHDDEIAAFCDQRVHIVDGKIVPSD